MYNYNGEGISAVLDLQRYIHVGRYWCLFIIIICSIQTKTINYYKEFLNGLNGQSCRKTVTSRKTALNKTASKCLVPVCLQISCACDDVDSDV